MTRINTRPRSTSATLADAELEETIQALSNVHLKPPGDWHAPSLAPRQKRNKQDVIELVLRWRRIRALFDTAVEAIPKPANYESIAKQFETIDHELMKVDLDGNQ